MQVSCRGKEESLVRRREREEDKLEGKKEEFSEGERDGDECFGFVSFLILFFVWKGPILGFVCSFIVPLRTFRNIISLQNQKIGSDKDS